MLISLITSCHWRTSTHQITLGPVRSGKLFNTLYSTWPYIDRSICYQTKIPRTPQDQLRVVSSPEHVGTKTGTHRTSALQYNLKPPYQQSPYCACFGSDTFIENWFALFGSFGSFTRHHQKKLPMVQFRLECRLVICIALWKHPALRSYKYTMEIMRKGQRNRWLVQTPLVLLLYQRML